MQASQIRSFQNSAASTRLEDCLHRFTVGYGRFCGELLISEECKAAWSALVICKQLKYQLELHGKGALA